jgi:tetratricopeptide (TPR) repeat protein
MNLKFFILFISFTTFCSAIQAQTPPTEGSIQKTFPQATASHEPTAEDYMKQAIAHFDGGRYQQSLELLEKAILVNKEGRLSDILYYYRGLVFYKMKNYQKMLSSLDTAIAFNPTKSNYHYYRAEAFFGLGDFSQAQNNYKKTVDMEPLYDAAWLKYGILLQQNNKIREALIAYDRSIEINTKNPEAYYYRGLLMLQVGMPDKGCLDLEKAADLDYRAAEKAMKQYCGE